MKKNIQRLKDDIRSQVNHQIITKSNRKTVRFKGVRIMPPYEAAYKALINRENLRNFYIAYAILRKKDPIDHLGTKKLKEFPQVDMILKKYKHDKEVVCSDQE